MRKAKKTYICSVALVLATCICLYGAVSVGASVQNKINEAQNEINNLKNKAEAADEKIDSAEAKKSELEKVVQEMDKQVTAAMTEYNKLATEQAALEAEIAQAEAALQEATEKEESQYEAMKLRIQYMYEVGNQSYLEMLMSSDNFVELINNAAYIIELSLYDRDMLQSYQDTKDQIAESKTLLEEDNAKLSVLVTDAKTKLDEVNTLLEDKQEEVDAYKAEIARLEDNKEIYEEQIEEQTALIATLEKQNASQIQKPSSNSSSSSSSSSTPTTSNGAFVWPVPASSRVTSDFGNRYHPSTGKYHFHSGIDIAASTGSSILAASGGTVTSAGWNSSMGNYVMIAHGNGLVTIYMHASVLCVQSGQTVSAGQQIALVGSTGDSTGPHLHFSVRLNGSYVSPWNYL